MKISSWRLRWLNKRFLWIFIGLVVLLVIIGGMNWRNTSKIKSLQVKVIENEQGHRFVREDDVRDMLFKHFQHALQGELVGKVNISEVEAVLEKDMFVKNAQVYIDAQANAHIIIQQREPVVRVMGADDKDGGYYLDIEGKRIQTSTNYTARVPVITGAIGVFTPNYLEVEENRLNRAFQLLLFILKDEFLKAQIEQIHIENTGQAQLVPKLGDHTVFFGTPNEDMQEKFDRLKTFYKEGLSRRGWNLYKSVSIAYKDQVVCKKR